MSPLLVLLSSFSLLTMTYMYSSLTRLDPQHTESYGRVPMGTYPGHYGILKLTSVNFLRIHYHLDMLANTHIYQDYGLCNWNTSLYFCYHLYDLPVPVSCRSSARWRPRRAFDDLLYMELYQRFVHIGTNQIVACHSHMLALIIEYHALWNIRITSCDV